MLRHGVIVAIAPPVHAADEAAGRSWLSSLAKVLPWSEWCRRAGLEAAALEYHVERPEGQVAIIDRADHPADDEPREEIQHGRQLQLGAAAGHKLRGAPTQR